MDAKKAPKMMETEERLLLIEIKKKILELESWKSLFLFWIEENQAKYNGTR